MAMSVTSTRVQQGSLEVIDVTWTTASDGSATGTVDLNGMLLQVEFDPGSAAPTAAYDPSFTSPGGYDLFQGVPDSLSATATERHSPMVPSNDGTTAGAFPPICFGTHTFAIANGGDTKSGVTRLFLKKL